MNLSAPIVALLSIAVSAAGAQPPPLASAAFRNATVIDIRTGQLHAGYTVVITGSRIAAVGPAAAVQIPTGARVVEGTGKYLIPGLTDTHVHLTSLWAHQPADTLAVLGWILASGVTGLRDMSGDDYQRLLALRAASESGHILSPRLFISAQPDAALLKQLGIADRVAAIQRLRELGVDGIKLLGLARDTSLAIISAARAAGMPVYGHIFHKPEADGRINSFIDQALDGGIDGVVHGLEPLVRPEHQAPAGPFPPRTPEAMKAWQLYFWTRWRLIDDRDLQALLDVMVARHTWWEPTLTLGTLDWNRDQYDLSLLRRYFTWDSDPAPPPPPIADAEVRAAVRVAQAETKRVVRRFYEAGGTLLAGSDGIPFPPLGVTEELRLLVEAGLPPLAALQAATLNAARAMQMEGALGAVEEGMLADLVLLDANPLVAITNVRRVNAVVTNRTAA